MNSAALLKDGTIAFVQSKMLLPTYDVFDEMRNFAPAPSQQLLPFCGKQMALTICEDAWNDKAFLEQAPLQRSIPSKRWSGGRKFCA